MATIDFPSSPTTGQKYTFNGIVYTFTGKTWTASANITDFTSPNLTGTPTAATPPTIDNSQRIATTAYVLAAIAANVPPPFPAGTTMIFKQSTSPVGWTKSTTDNDKALRVVSGSAASGGFQPFSTAFGRTAVDNTTLDGNTLPAHAHSVADPTHGHGLGDPGHTHWATQSGGGITCSGVWDSYYTINANWGDQWAPVQGAGTGMWVGGAGTGIGIYNAGGSAPHAHGIDLRVQYVDVIVATKD
jgi:hypothetical protein